MLGAITDLSMVDRIRVDRLSVVAGLREKEISTADGPAAAQLSSQTHRADSRLSANVRCAACCAVPRLVTSKCKAQSKVEKVLTKCVRSD